MSFVGATTSPSFANFLLDPSTQEDIGLNNVFSDTAPTKDLVDAVRDLSEAIGRAPFRGAEKRYGTPFREAASALKVLFDRGGRPNEYQRWQDTVGRELQSMRTLERRQLVAATGWEKAAKTYLPAVDASGIDPDILKLMLQAQAGAGVDVRELAEFVAIPSVSGDPLPNPEVERSADWVLEMMRKAGLMNVRLLKAKGANPSVYAKHIVDPGKPTVMFYAHHDKVGADQEGWLTNPFEMVIKEGRGYGRGAADDGAGFMAALSAVRTYLQAGVELPVNVIFFVEGEEEFGSKNLERLLDKIPDIKPDVVLLADSTNVLPGRPTITVSTAGVVNLTIRLQTAEFGTHPGIFSFVPDALGELIFLLAHMKGADRAFYFPGLTTNVPTVPKLLLDSCLPYADEIERVARLATGLYEEEDFLGDRSLPVNLRAGRRFALKHLDIRGSQKDFNKAVGVNVHKVAVKLQFRIPPGFDVKKVASTIKRRLKKLTPPGVKIRFEFHKAPLQPWEINLEHPSLPIVSAALAAGYGQPTIYDAIGGGIGFLDAFQRRFPETLLVPVGVEDPFTRAHSPNESLNLDDYVSATRSMIAFLAMMGQRQQAVPS